MGPIATRRFLRRSGRRAAGVLALCAIVMAVVGHHIEAPDSDHCGDCHHGDVASMQMCLGALTAVGAAVAAVAIGMLASGRWKAVLMLRATGLRACADVPRPVPRAGPALLDLLCVSRR